MTIKHGIGGKYRLYKHKEGEKPQEISGFNNLITNYGIERILKNAPLLNMSIGSGNATPQATDLGLQTKLYNTSASLLTYGGKNDETTKEYYKYWVWTASFEPKGSPYIIREVGFGDTGDGTGIFSRTLTKNQDGETADIVVGGDEYFIVTYELRLDFGYDDYVFTMNPTGEDTEQRTITVVNANRAHVIDESLFFALGGGSKEDVAGSYKRALFICDGTTISSKTRTSPTIGTRLYTPEATINIDPLNPLRFSISSGTISPEKFQGDIGSIGIGSGHIGRYTHNTASAFLRIVNINPPITKTYQDEFSFTLWIEFERIEIE